MSSDTDQDQLDEELAAIREAKQIEQLAAMGEIDQGLALKENVLAVLAHRGMQGGFEREHCVQFMSGALWSSGQLAKLDGKIKPEVFIEALESAALTIGVMDRMRAFGFHAGNLKELETSRGIAWTADLFLDGEKVGTIENDGNGGQTRWHSMSGGHVTHQSLRAKLEEASEGLCDFEPEVRFLEEMVDIHERERDQRQ